MKCPTCGALEERRETVCSQCGATYASEDLLAFRQLEFLLAETDGWTERLPADLIEELRQPYVKQLADLRARLIPKPAPAAPPPAVEEVIVPAEVVPAAPPPPKAERVPFDEWLLSERNIKIALYSGAVLLVMAGIIFIGSRWGQLGGPAKFAVMLLATGLLYLGGYLLYQRQGLRLGGIAILGVASGFLPLNFAVLQIYVLRPGGFHDDVMWLIASPICLLLYVLTAYWTRADLFTYISIGALASTLTAGLTVAKVPNLAYLPAHLLLALLLLLLARRLQDTPLAGFTYRPLLIVTHSAAPLLTWAAMLGFAPEFGVWGSPWLAVAGMFTGVLFYVTTDVLFGWLAARWAAAGLFPLAFGLTLLHLDFSKTALGVALMLLAIAYLGVGYGLERLQRRRMASLPLITVAYILAALVTFQAIGDTQDLILILLGDVALLALSGAMFRHYAWFYGAVWLFMLPAYLFLTQKVPALANRGLLMGVLGLNYLAAGYALSRREVSAGDLPRRGGPFLTAAAFLSAAVVALAWGSPVIVTLLLAVVAALYLGAALWLGWSPLLLPALVAVNLGVFTTQEIFLGYGVVNLRALDIAYAALTLALLLGGLGLRRLGQGRWAWPLYVVGALDLAGSYGAALLDRPLAIVLSAIYATLFLAYAWLERDTARLLDLHLGNLPGQALTCLGLGTIVVGHFYVLGAVGILRDWPPYTAGLCALFVLVAWLLRREDLAVVYETPLRWVGLGLMLLPMVGALVSLDPLVIAITFGIVGLTYAADAAARRLLYLAYLAGAAFLVVYWALLVHFGVDEPQSYVIPTGLALLGLGWNEHRRGGNLTYRLPTLLGLVILLGSSFVQSLPRGAFIYAAWLGMESLAAIGWGVRTRSRGYVSLGTLALVTNVVAQFGPAFVELPRWIQLGLTGGILLGGGIAFLVRREELLRTRRALTEEWRRWQP
jgi:hypothetical protein